MLVCFSPLVGLFIQGASPPTRTAKRQCWRSGVGDATVLDEANALEVGSVGKHEAVEKGQKDGLIVSSQKTAA